MTDKEREEVVSQRLAKGWPAHSPPHPFRGAGNYIISATNFDHEPIMAQPSRRTDFEARLLDKLNEIHVNIFAWVILPNDYHAVVSVNRLEPISAALKA
jgi:putative transposase